MGIFDRMARGWEISKSSLAVLNENKQLLIFPFLSGLSLAAIAGSFLFAFYTGSFDWLTGFADTNKGAAILVLFLFYIVNYFIIAFFNMALMHCATLYFDGEEASVSRGLQFSISRIGKIFAWAVFAATIGTLLKLLQENLGWLGKILVAFAGIAWGITTFFVVPILAYEDLGPADALKRSATMMRDKWGESVGATFSFGIVQLVGMIVFVIVGTAITVYVNEAAGILCFVGGIVLTFMVSSTMKSIFISAVYNNINGNASTHFHQKTLDGLFESKD